eukprot:s4702_g5.t1
MDRHNVYSKKAGKRRQHYVGGAQLTLDMSTAFDRLPRQYMQEALEWAQVDASLASLILDTHCSCRYHIRHEGFESTVDMENGVRQGCTLAPLIWALYSVYLIHQLELRLHSTWPREALTLYADDTHCAWELNSLADLKFFIRSTVLLLSVYQQFGMKINPEKSALMIRLVGTHGSKWVQRHTLCIDNKPLFLFSHDLQTFHIPIVKQAKYLGVGQRRSDKAYDQALEENVKLLARLCLRHEDELSQMRVERDFVITMETQEAAVLSKLYRLSTVWKDKKETGEVDCSLRLALFLALCQVWLERMRALEAATAEAQALRERIIELGQAFIPEGQSELHWWYMRWDPTTSTLMKLADVEPLKQSQIVNSLTELQQVISSPTVLQRFHSTRRMSSTYEGETAWGLLNNLSGNSSGKVIGLRMRPTRMDRQPVAKVVAERFPPPAPRRRETQQRGSTEQEEVASKPVEEGS